ncbi:TPA: hypothetical protein N2C58_005160 [Pseudomonas aeruginosa]|nr:hypothetical protein [Pseudomonas aeruginosa]
MSLETQIAALVEAANNLTGSVNGKVGEIDQRMNTAEAEFDEWRNQKDVEGDPSCPGTIRRNILQGHIYSTGGPSQSPSSLGAFAKTDLGTMQSVYVHFKLPLNVNTDSEMFWFNIKGYSYGTAKIVEETLVGYSYAPARSLQQVSTFGNFSPAVYKDTAGNVVMRILVPNIYYTTLRIDTMRVGNGRLFNVGAITTKLSLAETVEF